MVGNLSCGCFPGRRARANVCKFESSPRELVLSEELVNSALQAFSTTAFPAGSVCQVVSFPSGELGRADGEIELSHALARHGAYEPPSPTSGVERGGDHGDRDVDRRSINCVPQPQPASVRRPQVDRVPDPRNVLIAGPPSDRSIRSALANILDRQDQAIFDDASLFASEIS